MKEYLIFLVALFPLSFQEAVRLTQQNIEEYKNSKDVMLLNFYADWCRYSSALKPIYDKAADQIHSETDKATLGKVDCEADKHLCQNVYHINKYPTLKIARNGQIMRKEYRGQRSVESLVNFIRNELKDPVQIVEGFSQVFDKIKDNVKGVIGQFTVAASDEYQIFWKIASSMKDDCKFFVIFNENEPKSTVTFREHGFTDVNYGGDTLSEDNLRQWLYEKCVPLVREITFENGEEMTEEGLPFLILFYHPDHQESKTLFREKVQEELSDERGNINFVTADGVRFAHPLSHLGKTKKDLPLIAIDSFKHMYVFPNYEDIKTSGKLKEFVADLHSGKLHKDFHNIAQPHNLHVGHGNHGQQKREEPPANKQGGEEKPSAAAPAAGGGGSQPPLSTFKKLKPANSRYTLLKHDEL